MAKDNHADAIVIHDGAERRHFMRKGAVFVVTAGVIGTGATRSVLASDCDRGGSGEQKPEHAGNGSDSDSGENADPTGCGRNYEEKPKISKAAPAAEHGTPMHVSVAKITG